ncbi:MAG: hypothetical protein AAGU27_08865 [Dehalobacterium sp.]
MTPDEVLEKLKKIGVEITPATLHNYVKWELIDAPLTKSMGRVKGRITKYDDDAFAKIYAAYRLMNEDYKLTKDHVREVTSNALSIIYDIGNNRLKEIIKQSNEIVREEYESESIFHGDKYLALISPVDKFVFLWIFYYCQALENVFYDKANIVICWSGGPRYNESGYDELFGCNELKLVIDVNRPEKSDFKYGSIMIYHEEYRNVIIKLIEICDYNNKFSPIIERF